MLDFLARFYFEKKMVYKLEYFWLCNSTWGVYDISAVLKTIFLEAYAHV